MALLKNRNEMIRLKKAQGPSEIPEGPYCYTIKEVVTDEEHGVVVKTNLCPYWDEDNEKESQMNGFCWFLNKGDWEEDGTDLLWDQCKSCDYHLDEWFGMEAKDEMVEATEARKRKRKHERESESKRQGE